MSIWRATVNLKFSRGSGGGTNTWHLRDTGVDVGANLSNLMGHVKTFYEANASNVGTGYTFTFDGVYSTVDEDPPVAREATGDAWVVNGAGGGSYLDTQSCVVYGWRTELPTRSGRGRTFIGPLNHDILETGNGTIAPASLTSMKAAADELIGHSMNDGNGAIVVWSPTTNLAHDITGVKIRDTFAHLSSRRGNA